MDDIRFLARPNLPDRPVKVAAVASCAPDLRAALEKIGIECILFAPYAGLDEPVNSHPDMLMHHLGGNRILLVDRNVCDEEKLRWLGFRIQYSEQKLSALYPGDILLNCVRVGACAFGNWKHADGGIIRQLEEDRVNRCFVKQGYAKCSTCVVDERSVVSSDPSILHVCAEAGYDALSVPSGGIAIPRYDTGFIGGCTGLVSKTKLAFYGDARQLGYYNLLTGFLAQRNMELVCLCDDQPPTDVGSIIPLMTL